MFEERHFIEKGNSQAPVEGETFEQKEKREYIPLEALRRDFNETCIGRNKEGKAVIDDPDLHTIFGFYRAAVKEGSLLDLGAGTTHHHYMAAIEDKLSEITALDLSPRNIELLRELQEHVSGTSSRAPKSIEGQDLDTFRLTAEAIAADPRYGEGRTAENILRDIAEKTTRKDGSPDLIVGDMYDLEAVLGDRKFDNVLLGFSLFVSKDEKDLITLFKNIGSHLEKNGRIIIADFEGFDQEVLEEDFMEDEPVLSRYHTDFPLDSGVMKRLLKAAKFSGINVAEKPVEAETEEKEHGLRYLFASANKAAYERKK